MKKMFKLLVILFILYFGVQQLYVFLNREHSVSYKIHDVMVNELYRNKKGITDGYYFDVVYNEYSFPFKIFDKLNKQKHIIDDVKIYEGDIYVCANISIKKDFNATNIKCYKDDVLYYYSDIKGIDSKLDNMIKESAYDINKFTGDSKGENKDDVTYYINNFYKKHNILLSVYKGAYLFGNKVTNNARFIKLFDKDQYNKGLEYALDKYYIVADYNDTHEFLSLKRINIATGGLDEIKIVDPISFDSFIQGGVDNKLYIIDRPNKAQYEIDLKTKTEDMVGGINSGAQVYTNNEWKTLNINDVINDNIVFNDDVSNLVYGNQYEFVKHYGNIYVVFEKNEDYYDAYMIYEEDNWHAKNHIFKCSDPSKVTYKNGYFYYTLDDEIKIFKDSIGNRTLIKYSELKYNKNLNYFVY